MRFSLINPPWDFESSIYFGCREPHLPLEFGYSKVLLERAGHEVQIVDGQAEGLTLEELHGRVSRFGPDFAVVTTAPSYLFWRCPPPELRIPKQVCDAIRDSCGSLVAVGPHGSTTPAATLRKLEADAVLMGECEDLLPKLGEGFGNVEAVCYRGADGEIHSQGSPNATDMSILPALHWPSSTVRRHAHHHHRFDSAPVGPGAEMETSRGCPYHCTFCAKDNFRNGFRRRPLSVIEEELEGFKVQSVEYVYFIDEIFLPFRDVLELIGRSGVKFGIQTRIDLWSEEMIHLLAASGCVSIEAGVESISEAGRSRLDKKCRISTEEISNKLVTAKAAGVLFVQGNLLDSMDDDPADVERWRHNLLSHGVWSNKPVPLFPYPGSPDYQRLWGRPDDKAWERAHEFYLAHFDEFSDVQEKRPVPLVQLEGARG